MQDEQHPLAAALNWAAAALMATTSSIAADTAGAELLQYLGYDNGDTELANRRARMLRAAARFRRLFLLAAPDAPGLVFFGGEADPVMLGPASQGLPSASLAGSGLAPQKAFESCVGEGIEYLSQFVQAGDPHEHGTFADYGESPDESARRFIAGILSSCGLEASCRLAWVPAIRLTDGVRIWFPRDLCYRRSAAEQDFRPPLKLSSGCAAGQTLEDATLRGLLELIERDAVALWWRGGRRGRPVASDSDAAREVAALLVQLRQGRVKRETRLLDITTDVGIPAVTAISTDAGGANLALGFGARLTLAEAARAAVFELCQVELGLHVVAAKRREAGAAALNESDRRQLRRADIGTCALLRPEGRPSILSASASGLQQVLERLQARGIAAYAIDLTRPQLDVPVVRVLAPGLQLDPCEVSGARLAREIAETGGGAQHHGGLPLM